MTIKHFDRWHQFLAVFRRDGYVTAATLAEEAGVRERTAVQWFCVRKVEGHIELWKNQHGQPRRGRFVPVATSNVFARAEVKTLPEALGAVLRKHRTALRLTLIELETCTGITRNALMYYEHGEHDMPVRALELVALTFRVSASQLVAEAEELLGRVQRFCEAAE